MAHQDSPLYAHGIQETAQVFSHVGTSVAAGSNLTVTMAAQIVGSDAVLAAQDGRHVEVPDRQITKESVQHHHVWAHADRDVMQVYSVRFYLRHFWLLLTIFRVQQYSMYTTIGSLTTVRNHTAIRCEYA